MLLENRYLVTKDDLVVMASEAGVLDITPERIAHKGRLQPGRMLLVDTVAGRIISDEELKQQVAAVHPYQDWLDQHLLSLDDLDSGPAPAPARWAAASPASGPAIAR